MSGPERGPEACCVHEKKDIVSYFSTWVWKAIITKVIDGYGGNFTLILPKIC